MITLSFIPSTGTFLPYFAEMERKGLEGGEAREVGKVWLDWYYMKLG